MQGERQHFLPESQKHFVSFEIDPVTVPREKLIFFRTKNHLKGSQQFQWENAGIPLGKTGNKTKWKFSF